MKRPLVIFFFIIFLIGTDTMLTSPLLPTLVQNFHVAPQWAGWMVGAYAAGYALFALVAGPFSDRRNRKHVMLGGLVAFSLSTLLCALAWDFASMVSFRALAGISAAFITPQIWASIPQIAPQEKLVQAMGIVTGGLAAAQIVGIPLSSFLASAAWYVPFIFIGLGGLVLFLPARAGIPDLVPQAPAPKEFLFARYLRLFARPKLGGSLLAYFIFQVGNYAIFIFMATWLQGEFSWDVRQVGLFFLCLGLGNLGGSLWGHGLVKRWGHRRTLLGSQLVTGILFALIPLFHIPWVGLAGFLVTFFLFGSTLGLMLGRLQSLAPESRGTVSSLANSVMYLAATVAGGAGGLVFAHGGYPPLAVAAGTWVVTAFFLWKATWTEGTVPSPSTAVNRQEE